MRSDGQLPAYEWDFADVNPPVQGCLAMAVWRIDARRRSKHGLPPDNDFLERVFHKLLLNFTWWVNRKDAEGSNVFEGGFLGLDNIGLFDRSRPLPVPGVLEQSDGTAWMAMYCMSLLEIGLRLADTDPTYEDIAVRFYEHHLDHPFTLEVGNVTATIDYEPGESTTGLFGGNSNWRGPVWFPLNYLFINALYRYGRYYGQSMKVEHPVGSGVQLTLDEVADEITRRLVSLFLPGPDGRRPVHGDYPLLQEDPAWRDPIWFHEYFHGDTGAGLGASHQTGWTGLVLHLIAAREMATDER